ncbi:hypothetical protein [Nannocystis radixulma]|uniref:Uncharacterized protein n=1 Tax=Nannocystis radixulma TaxID=2995305 RepID=A0ABT5B1Q0_9BACT|nr:hypothetical protein [Nannocystis radixulma]MDC0667668.1 hypothetical protein [Nannocystis radixulma]
MAWFYLVDGSVRFPDADGPKVWRDTPIRTWRGKGKVTVSDVLGWTGREALVDESAPASERNAYFFDAAADGPVLTIRGFLHRDDADAVTALLDVAAELDARGKVLLHHVFDRASSIRVDVEKGAATVREGNVRMPGDVIEAIERESTARAKRLGDKKAAPQPKKKTAAKKTAAKKTTATKTAAKKKTSRG